MKLNSFFGRAAMATLIGTAALAATPASAQEARPTINSSSFVEKTTTDANGNKKVTLAPTTVVVPGDTVLFVHEYKNNSSAPAAGFIINNPLPAQVQYVGSTDANIVVSVDGGKTFGKLETLKVGDRAATGADVTHVRWTFAQPIGVGQSGKVSFRGLLK